MKTYTYTVEEANGDIHTGTSTQRILDIVDVRRKQNPNCEEIHYSFFELLTLQISPQIRNALGMELSKSYTILCPDNLFIKEDNCFYILIYLTGKDASEYFWVKCDSQYDSEILNKQISGLSFLLCDSKTHKACDVQRFGYSHHLVGIDSIKYSFELNAQSNDPSRFESDYPDVILKVRMKSKVTDAIKDEIYGLVTRFIQSWNEQADEFSQIHEAQLQDKSPNKYTVCVYIDFGSSDPASLEGLFHYLTEHNDRIKEINI